MVSPANLNNILLQVIEMSEVSHSSRGDQLRFIEELKSFRALQKTELYLELAEEQVR